MKRTIVSAIVLVNIAVFCLANSSVELPTESPRIVVIGAGLAGLKAAQDLRACGFEQVMIYEAKDRVGGRIMTCMFVDADGKKNYAELGAENILDAEYAPHIHTLIQELGLEFFSQSNPEVTVKYYDGQAVIDPHTKMISHGFTKESLWQEIEKASVSAKNLDEILSALFKDDADANLRLYFSLRLACFEGGFAQSLSTWYSKSLYRFLLDKVFVGQNEVYDKEERDCLCVKGGNGQITEILGEKLKKYIALNHQLKSILRDDKGIYTLTFANGKVVRADIVILTMPCTVYGDINFADNVIPADKLSVIQNVQYGKNAKISFPTTQKVTDVYCNEYAVVYQALQGDVVTLFYCDGHGDFTQDTIGSVFAQDIPFIRATTNINSYIAQPMMAEDKPMQAYNGAVGYSWLRDPFAKGSYSFIAPGQESVLTPVQEWAGEKVRTVFAPLNDNTLFFAGEHTTVYLDNLGTMEAAVESGVRTAKIIQKLYPACTNVCVNSPVATVSKP